MADYTTAGLPGGLPSGLPQDYQAQLDEQTRKQQIAQAIAKMANSFQGPVQSGPVASRTSMFSALGNAGLGAYGNYAASQAAKDAQGIRRGFQTDQLADVQKLQAMDPEAAIKAGQISQFPMSQAIAKSMADKREKENSSIGGFYSANGDVPNAVASVRGLPTAAPKEQKQPEYILQDDPNEPGKKILTVKEYDKQGVPSIKFAPAGTSVRVDNHPLDDQSKEINATIGKTLTEKRGVADVARNNYAAASQAVDALESGAKAGGGQITAQALRKAAQTMGVNLPETSSTEELSMALGQAALAGAQKLRPASDTDLKLVSQMVGNISSDPTALPKVLALTQAMSLRDLQSYHDYVGANQETADPKLKDLFRGATSGYDMPTQLSGPPAYQMEVVRKLQSQGYDISKLAGPDGKPFDRNAHFTIDPTQGFPGIQKNTPPPAPGTAQAPLTVDQLSPEQKTQLMKLLGGK